MKLYPVTRIKRCALKVLIYLLLLVSDSNFFSVMVDCLDCYDDIRRPSHVHIPFSWISLYWLHPCFTWLYLKVIFNVFDSGLGPLFFPEMWIIWKCMKNWRSTISLKNHWRIWRLNPKPLFYASFQQQIKFIKRESSISLISHISFLEN